MRASKLPSLRGEITNGQQLRQSLAKAIGEVQVYARRSKSAPSNGTALKDFLEAGIDAVDAAIASASFAKPVNTVAPAITGTATAGQTLTVTNGTWTGTPTPTYTRQWQRTIGGVTTNIGAGATTYVLQAGDVGATISVVVTASNSVSAVTQVSNSTAAVAGA